MSTNLQQLTKQAQCSMLTAFSVCPQANHLSLKLSYPGQGQSSWVKLCFSWKLLPPLRVSSPFLILCKAHHCSSCFRCFGVSCSGTTQLDAGPLDSYLSEVSTPKGSGLVRPSVKRSSRSSSVTVFSCEGESPSEGLSVSNRRRHLASSCNLAQCHPKLLLGRREQPC